MKKLKILFLSVALSISNILSYSQEITLFGVSDCKQVFEDGYKVPAAQPAIKVFGIRGEIISAQCALTSKKNLSNVTVEVGDLKSSSGNSFNKRDIEWNFVGSIPLPNNTPNQPAASVVRAAPADFPDYLMAERTLNVSKGKYKAVWLTITIPENLPADVYSGNVTVRSNEGSQSLPLEVTVYPLTLPNERNIAVVEWDNRSKFEQYHGIKEKFGDEWFAMVKKYADNMVAHRQNSFQVAFNTIGVRKTASGYEFDFSLFDKVADVFWSTGKMDWIELGLSDNRGELTNRGEKRWASPEIFISDLQLRDLEKGGFIAIPGREILPHFMPAVENHLRQKGWLKKAWLHICDEPAMHNSLSWTQVSAWIHSLAPEIRRLDALETEYLLDLGEIEVAVPKLDAFASWYEDFKKAPEQGIELWFYTVGTIQGSQLPNKTIDMPVIESRVLHWLNYRYDAPGYLHWGWNQWSDDPYKVPGRHLGDAWHVYPVKDGVLNSIRWEQMRNGLQDYEVFTMLEKKISALKDSLGYNFKWIDPKHRGHELSARVVKGFTDHSGDPEVLYNAKMAAIRELMEFNKSPRIYVQTNPIETSVMTNQLSVGIFGWAEPGTKVTINGAATEVGSTGLFLAQSKLSLKRGTITIEAKSDKGSKTITREYVMKP